MLEDAHVGSLKTFDNRSVACHSLEKGLVKALLTVYLSHLKTMSSGSNLCQKVPIKLHFHQFLFLNHHFVTSSFSLILSFLNSAKPN